MASKTPLVNTTDEAYNRLAKAIMRLKAVDSLVKAIEGDIKNLDASSVLRKRSVRVIEYMTGYRKAVEDELAEANAIYDEEAYMVVKAARLAARKAKNAT